MRVREDEGHDDPGAERMPDQHRVARVTDPQEVVQRDHEGARGVGADPLAEPHLSGSYASTCVVRDRIRTTGAQSSTDSNAPFTTTTGAVAVTGPHD